MDETELVIDYTDIVSQRAIALTKVGLAMDTMSDAEARHQALLMMDKLVRSIKLPPQGELITFPGGAQGEPEGEDELDIGSTL